MKYASVCSGIEAASVAWEPLGWRPAWFSEIEPFPCAVLAHRFPNVPNMGDMTKIKGDEHGTIDILVGGTPCQDLSIAGKRMGFGGKRSVLALDFVRLAYESGAKLFAWENVPGVFSSNGGEDFAQLLSLFAGWQVDTPSDGWGRFGIVEQSPGCFGLAWRVLDVQYARVDGFPNAIPQRRNRVFVVGYLGDWRRAAQVLFEPEGLLGNTPPRREAGEGTAPTLSARTRGGGGLGTDFDCDGGLIAGLELGNQGSGGNVGWFPTSSPCRTLDTGHPPGVVHNLRAQSQCNFREDAETIVFDMKQPHNPQETETVNLTTENCSTIRGDSPLILDARGNGDGVNGAPCVAFAQNSRDEVRLQNGDGQICGALAAEPGMKQQTYIAVKDVIHGDKSCNGKGWSDEGTAYTLDTMATQGVCASTVRRLTPIECERLMGFPPDWTRIPWRGKPAEDCPDGPRYKACGNSMGVNVMRWIGIRIQEVVDSMKIPLDTAGGRKKEKVAT